MNPYVMTAFAMCAVVLVALAGTAYLAVYFNRRAKADLQQALNPLAKLLDGSVNLDEAEVSGSYQGCRAYGRMANASEGPGRVFQVDLLDASGGSPWTYTSNQHVSTGQSATVDYVGPDELQGLVSKVVADHIDAILEPNRERFRLEYLKNQGFLRFTRSIKTRRDIPDAASFESQLQLVKAVAMVNRPFMENISHKADAADSTGDLS